MRGAPAIRSQIENITARWEQIKDLASERERMIENALTNLFVIEVNQLNKWGKDKEREVNQFDKRRPKPRDVERYIQVYS